MLLQNLFEAQNTKILVIYPGRFQPFHKGHRAVYDSLVKRFGDGHVWIATSDKVEPPRSPFSFVEKQAMIQLTGIKPNHVVLTKNPYQAQEIVANYDAANTILVFAVSEKDMAEDPRFRFGPKKDGSPSFLQPLPSDLHQCETLDKHGYMLSVPVVEFKVLGKPMQSASMFRAEFAKAKDPVKKKMIQDLFGAYNDKVFNLMKTKITESIGVADAVQFHTELNPKLWQNGYLDHDVENHLNEIADFFVGTLKVPDLKIVDITLSGSNAAFTYTPHSDIDLHIVVDVPVDEQPMMRELFDAKKNLFNQKHNITIRGSDVELYVQFMDQPHESAGIYSLKRDVWDKYPEAAEPATIDDDNVRDKARFLIKAINFAVNTDNIKFAERLAVKIAKYRKEGLAANGEFGVENLVFKILRNAGYLDKLGQFRQQYWDSRFTLEQMEM